MLFTRNFLCLFLTILIIETLKYFAHAKSLPHNLNRRKHVISKIHRPTKDLSNLPQNEPVLYTPPKPVKHLSSSSQSTDNTPKPFMNDVEYDLRLRQLMEELVLRSNFENEQDTNTQQNVQNTHTPQNSLGSISSENTKAEDPQQDSLFDYVLRENITKSKQILTKLAKENSIDAHQIQQHMEIIQENTENLKKFQQVQERTKMQFNDLQETKHSFENFLTTNLSHKMNTLDENFELSETNHTSNGGELKGVLHQINFIQQSNNSQPNTTETTTKMPDSLNYSMKTKHYNASGEQVGTSQNYLASINLEKFQEKEESEKVKHTHEIQTSKPLNIFDDNLHLFTNSPYTMSSLTHSPTERISIIMDPKFNITDPTSKINESKEEVFDTTSDLKILVLLTKQKIKEDVIAPQPNLKRISNSEQNVNNISNKFPPNAKGINAATDEQEPEQTQVENPSYFDIAENLKPLFTTDNFSLTDNDDIPTKTQIPENKTSIPESITVFVESESENLDNLEQQIEHLTVHTPIFQSGLIGNKNENQTLTNKLTHGDITFEIAESSTTQAPDLTNEPTTENYWNPFTTEFPQNIDSSPTEVVSDDVDSDDNEHTDVPSLKDILIFNSTFDIKSNNNKELTERNLNKISANQNFIFPANKLSTTAIKNINLNSQFGNNELTETSVYSTTEDSEFLRSDETIHESDYNRHQVTEKSIEAGQNKESQLNASTYVPPSHFTPIELKNYRFTTNSMNYGIMTTKSQQHTATQLPINDIQTSSMTTDQQSFTSVSFESALSPQEVETSISTKMQLLNTNFTKDENLKIYNTGFPKLSNLIKIALFGNTVSTTENSMINFSTENDQVLNKRIINPDKSIVDFPPTKFTTHYNDTALKDKNKLSTFSEKKSSHIKVDNISYINSKDVTLRYDYEQTTDINREKNESLKLKYENMSSSQANGDNFGTEKIMEINETKPATPLENINNGNAIEKFTEIPESKEQYYSVNDDNDLENNNDTEFFGQIEKYSKLSQEPSFNKFFKPLLEPSISSLNDNKSSHNNINSYAKFPKITDTDKVSSSNETNLINLISAFNVDNIKVSEPLDVAGLNINLIPEKSPNTNLENTTSTFSLDPLKDVDATNRYNENLKTQSKINSEKEESENKEKSQNFNFPTLTGMNESVTEVVWLTQSSSSYQTPPINIENVPMKTPTTGSLYSSSNDLSKTGNVKILKPEEKSENLNELISIIGNSLQETTKTNKHLQQNEHENDNSNDDNLNNTTQTIQEEVSSTVNCHTATMPIPVPYSLSSAMTMEIGTEEDVEKTRTNVDNRSAVVEKTIENDKKNIKKWSTFKNNQLNNDSITKSGNLLTKKNANSDDDGADTDSDEEVDFNVNTVEVNGNDKATYTTSSFIKDMRLEMKVENKGIVNGKIDRNTDNDRVVQNRNNYNGPIMLQQKGHETSNEFKVSQTEGGINEMSTIENKLLSISKHKSKFMTKTSTNPYGQHEMVNNKNTKKDNQNNGNEIINENISNNSNSISLIIKSNRDENSEEFEGPTDENTKIFDNLLKTQSFPALTLFPSNSIGINIRTSTSKNISATTQTKEEITTTNWWHFLPYAEIRKFLNSIFDGVTSTGDVSLNKSAYSALATTKPPKTTSIATTEKPASTFTQNGVHETIKERKPKKEQWPIAILNNIWSSLVMITRIFVS